MKKQFRFLNVFLSRILILCFFPAILAPSISYGYTPAVNEPGPPAIQGRWDLSINKDGNTVPSWFEVRHSGNNMLVGQFVGEWGSARPVSRVYFQEGKFKFSVPPQWEKGDGDVVVEGTVQGDSISGNITNPDGKTYSLTGLRAPTLSRSKETVWGKPVTLFNGKTLDGWHTNGPNQWLAVSGILRSPKSGSNIMTDKTFTDFKLHIEFRYPKESNSGVYLRGRYEVQIEDNAGMPPAVDYLGAIYGFISPSEMMAKNAGEWQAYDITLIGRMVTVIVNGKKIICNQEIPGITGGSLNSREGEAGPIFLQGDHGPIEFRNIVITPAL